MPRLFCCCLLLCAFTQLLAAPPAGVPLTYTLGRAAKVSLVITDAHGAIVRELLHGAPRAAGANQEVWDGLDEQGKPAAAGDYTWKLLSTQGLRAEYLLTLGTNPTPAYDSWPGNHGGASSVAVDGGAMYVAGGCGEGDPLAIKQTLDGARLWEAPNWLDAWMGGYALGVTNGKLFLLQQNGAAWRIDAATGKAEQRLDLIWEDADRTGGQTQELLDLAARDGQLVASYANHDAIRWLDPDTGKTLDEAAVPHPRGVTVAPDGRVLVVSGDQVVALTRATKTPAPLIHGLTDPWRLAVDPGSGDIFVVEHGASQQIKRFRKDGTLLRAYGTPGGRPREGRYDPLGFADVWDIAADGQGGFVIVEAFTAPRRTAHFDRDGKLLREWYGGQQYANFGAADPADPRWVWIESQWGALLQCRVDYQAHSWSVYAVYNYGGLANGIIAGHHHGIDGWYVRHHDGRTYLCRNDQVCVLEVDEAHRRLIPRAAMFIVFDGWKPSAYFKEAREKLGGSTILWTDLNGDGQPDFSEMQSVKFNCWGGERGAYIDDNMTYYRYPDDNTLWPFVITGWTPAGVPQYALGEKRPYKMPAGLVGKGAVLDARGDVFALADTAYRGPRLVAFHADGTPRWVAGQGAFGSVAAPGEMKQVYRIIGRTHDCTAIGDYANSMVHVWDDDGLWVGRFFDTPDTVAAPKSAYTLCGENFGGSLYTVPDVPPAPGLHPGDVLYFGGGQNNTPVYRITGWGTLQRQHGTVTLPPALAAQLTARVEAELKRADLAHIPFRKDIKMTGDPAQWQAMTPLEIYDGKTLRAKVYLAWNYSGLYAAYEVFTDTPWKSVATPTLAFQGGAAVDLNIGPLTPARTTAMPGDARIVTAPLNGKATSVEFLPRLPADLSPGDRQPASYETGQGTITFDRVAVLLNSAQSRPLLRATADPEAGAEQPTGYFVETRIPLHAPLSLRPGLRCKLDVSVILADADGRRALIRLPWHSTNPGDAITTDTFNESLLRPQSWGEAVLE